MLYMFLICSYPHNIAELHKKMYVYNIVSKYLRILINSIMCYCCKRLLSYYYKTQKSNTYKYQYW